MLQPAVIPSVQIRLVLRLIERTITTLIWEAALKGLGKIVKIYTMYVAVLTYQIVRLG